MEQKGAILNVNDNALKTAAAKPKELEKEEFTRLDKRLEKNPQDMYLVYSSAAAC
ncbi:hypothetical protein LQV63_22515 [Paenibacillus profundus]|uniref:Uncharacterized protein n=1 Tax=Paenibacillus profundus TaxID=1173085 RepID=A0ABS8YN79_9BACL|nr:hypothetical protein [Paenibacillus profundus]MCE5172060.1 hypothetical protein [Paenibacillus profundus]